MRAFTTAVATAVATAFTTAFTTAIVAAIVAAFSFTTPAHAEIPSLEPVTSVREDEVEPPVSDQVWRSERVCGVNALYFLLRAADVEAEYAVLSDRLLDRSDALPSLADLKSEASRWGTTLRIARFAPDDLRAAPKPIVAHLDAVAASGEISGHFVVVTAADEEGVTYVDGSTAETREMDWPLFKRGWSGHVAHLVPPTLHGWDVFPALVAGILSGVVLDRVWQSLRKRGNAPTLLTPAGGLMASPPTVSD